MSTLRPVILSALAIAAALTVTGCNGPAKNAATTAPAAASASASAAEQESAAPDASAEGDASGSPEDDASGGTDAEEAGASQAPPYTGPSTSGWRANLTSCADVAKAFPTLVQDLGDVTEEKGDTFVSCSWAKEAASVAVTIQAAGNLEIVTPEQLPELESSGIGKLDVAEAEKRGLLVTTMTGDDESGSAMLALSIPVESKAKGDEVSISWSALANPADPASVAETLLTFTKKA